MRLAEHQRQLIKQIAASTVGVDVEVLLFGSRVHDDARGGDIDLLVRSPHPLPARFETELQLGARLERALGGAPSGRLVDRSSVILAARAPRRSSHRGVAMTASAPHPRARLDFLVETVALETQHLVTTDARLFSEPFTPERA